MTPIVSPACNPTVTPENVLIGFSDVTAEMHAGDTIGVTTGWPFPPSVHFSFHFKRSVSSVGPMDHFLPSFTLRALWVHFSCSRWKGREFYWVKSGLKCGFQPPFILGAAYVHLHTSNQPDSYPCHSPPCMPVLIPA